MRRITLTLAACAALTLAGCGGDNAGENATAAGANQSSSDGMAAQLAGKSGFSTLSGALEKTGIATIFSDQQGSYTLLAPTDQAFTSLGEAGKQLQSDEAGAALAALLRDHILTGYSTLEDIESAIEAGGGKASLATVGGGQVTFTRTDGGIIAQSADGAQAKLVGDGIVGGNSIALPVDTVLKKI